jgi:hypothetical protein
MRLFLTSTGSHGNPGDNRNNPYRSIACDNSSSKEISGGTLQAKKTVGVNVGVKIPITLPLADENGENNPKNA